MRTRVFVVREGKTALIECEKCGPVETTTEDAQAAATAHLVTVHGANTITKEDK